MIKEDKSWSFADVTRKDTNYASHGYHKYPAKFIPQIVEKIIINYSNPKDIILDSFGGCGTTLVESKLNERKSIILDINKAALLIANAKKTAIPPGILEEYNQLLLKKINKIKVNRNYYLEAHQRLKYWFKPEQYNKLMEIFLIIENIKNPMLKIFYECCFSDILKKCSNWYSKSIKPMMDSGKKVHNPITSFNEHLNFMTSHNTEYYNLLRNKKRVSADILERDARNTRLPSNSIDLIITSPPYATSYEYADLHQLTLLWFGFTDDMNKTKRKFIGTTSNLFHENINASADKIIKKLYKKDRKLAGNINRYYYDLKLTFNEMYRVLKSKKIACIIMGDTEYKGVKIESTKVSRDLLQDIGFKVEKVIKRKLSSKTFTPFRDSKGKFTTSNKGNNRKIYQYEYILIAKK